MLSRSTAIFLLLLLFWSCEEIVDLDVDFNPAIVVVSEAAPGRQVRVSLSRARPILSQAPTEYVVADEVTILNNRTGQTTELFLHEPEKDTLNPNTELFPFYLSRDPLISGLTSYRLDVNIAGEAPISGFTTIPQRVDIQSLGLIDFSENIDPRDDNKFDISVELNFNHNSRISEFYHLVFYFIYVVEEENGTETVLLNRLQIPRVDNISMSFPYTFDFENGVLIRGEDMVEGNHHIEANLSVNFSEERSPVPPELFVELRNTNADYQNYHFNLSRQLSQRDSILSQAIIVPSNINNGLGVFSGYNLDIQSVSLTD